MPTAYTAEVGEGKITEFRDYAMLCARAFGACIMLRDEPLATDIPEFEPSDYHQRKLALANAELVEFNKSTDDELRIRMQDEIRECTEYHLSCIAKNDETRGRYLRMLATAREFTPPTAEHAEYAKFLVKQLEESIDFDCNNKYHEDALNRSLTFEQWKAEKLARLTRDVTYHANGLADEVERTKSRNAWVSALKSALEPSQCRLNS